MSFEQETPTFSKRRIVGGYLVWSDDGTRLFKLSRYAGDLAKPRADGTSRIVRGTCWMVRVLTSDDDGEQPPLQLVFRDDARRIVALDPEVGDYGQWHDLTNGFETLREAQAFALNAADQAWLPGC